MPGWLSRNNFSPSDFVHASDLNNLANDNITWGGDVNGGGYHLSNVILQGSGGFSAYVSPMEVTPGSAGTTCLQLDQTVGANHVARWTVCKDATAETGSNTGSNFAIGRYTDAGVVIDAPIAINRSTGLITMGAQQWAGAVNGGGQTLSNVVIPGTLADPTTTKGDLLARSASAVSRVALGADGFILTADSSQALGVKWAAAPATGVPTSRNINTGVGLSGGGPLTADLNLAGVVFGASGASHKSGDVPDPGAAAQATRYLREDATWAIPSGTGGGMTDPTTTKGDLIVHGSGITRLGVGTDGQALLADSTQALGVKWGTVSGGGSQTPWLTNIDGNGKALTNTGNVSIGGSTQGGALTVQAGVDHVLNVRGDPANLGLPAGLLGPIFQGTNSAQNSFEPITFVSQTNFMLGNVGIGTTAPVSKLAVVGAGSDGGGNCDVQITGSGTIGAGINLNSTDTGGKNWAIISSGSALGAGALGFFDKAASVYPLWITSAHNVGIGTTAPQATLDVNGTLNASGAFSCHTNALVTGAAKSTSAVAGLTLQSSDVSNPLQAAFSLAGTASTRLSIQCIEQGIAFRNVTLCESGGNVGCGTTAPRSALSICTVTATPSTPATATQFTIGESSNNSGFQLAVGLYYDNGSGGDGFYKGVLQTLHNGSPSAILLNPAGGNIGIRNAKPLAALDIIATGTPAASGNQNTGVLISNGFGGAGLNIGIDGGKGWIQSAYTNNAGTAFPLVLQPVVGSVGIGRAPSYALDVSGDVNCTGTFRVNGTPFSGGGIPGVGWLQGGVGVSTRPNCNFTAGGTIGYSVTDVPGSNRVDVFYSVGSDVRLKRNLIPLTGGLDLINRLRPYEFEYNGLGGREEGRRAVSVLAQDLQAIYPQGVTTYPAKLRPEDAETTDLLTFDTLDILFHAALAIQQLSARIETLEKRLKGH